MNTTQNLYNKTFDECQIHIALINNRPTIQFKENTGYGTYTIEYTDESIPYLLMSLESIYRDNINYPPEKIFWKSWFPQLLQDLTPLIYH